MSPIKGVADWEELLTTGVCLNDRKRFRPLISVTEVCQGRKVDAKALSFPCRSFAEITSVAATQKPCQGAHLARALSIKTFSLHPSHPHLPESWSTSRRKLLSSPEEKPTRQHREGEKRSRKKKLSKLNGFDPLLLLSILLLIRSASV